MEIVHSKVIDTQLERERRRMYDAAETYGSLHDSRVLIQSQKVDSLVNQEMKKQLSAWDKLDKVIWDEDIMDWVAGIVLVTTAVYIVGQIVSAIIN